MKWLKAGAVVILSYLASHVILASISMDSVAALGGSQSTGLWFAENVAPAIAVVIAFFAGWSVIRREGRRAAQGRQTVAEGRPQKDIDRPT